MTSTIIPKQASTPTAALSTPFPHPPSSPPSSYTGIGMPSSVSPAKAGADGDSPSKSKAKSSSSWSLRMSPKRTTQPPPLPPPPPPPSGPASSAFGSGLPLSREWELDRIRRLMYEQECMQLKGELAVKSEELETIRKVRRGRKEGGREGGTKCENEQRRCT